MHQEYTFSCRSSLNTVESGQVLLTTEKECTDQCKTWQDKGRRRVIRTEPASRVEGNWSIVRSPQQGNILGQWRLKENAAADLWQSEWNENHTDNLCGSPSLPWTGTQVSWNVWELGAGAHRLESNLRVRSVVDNGETTWGHVREETGEMPLGERQTAVAARRYCASRQGVEPPL